MLQNATQENIHAYQNARYHANKILKHSKILTEKTGRENRNIQKKSKIIFWKMQIYKARL